MTSISKKSYIVRLLLFILVFVVTIPFSVSSIAQGLPHVNLGESSFLDGGPPAPSGAFLQEIVDFYTTSTLKNNTGDTVPVDFNLDVFAIVNHFIYISERRLFGARIGYELLLPIVWPELDPGNSPLLTESSGTGDLIMGAILQWDPILRADGRPLFIHRLDIDWSVPTGTYSAHKDINPGNNFVTFNPYWASTLFLSDHWEMSLRLHYLWNGENDDPNVRFFPGAQNTQAGQAFHMNFAASFAVTPRLRVGVNGYYLKQLTNAEIDGIDIPGSREQVLAVGPGLFYGFTPDTALLFGAFFETQVRNRSKGNRFIFRILHHF